MNKIIPILLISLFICSTSFAQDEELTLTTYYPAPYGEYRGLAVGDTYTAPLPPANPLDPGTDLVVQGRVGICTDTPTSSLTIASGPEAIMLLGGAAIVTVDDRNQDNTRDDSALVLCGGEALDFGAGAWIGICGNEQIFQQNISNPLYPYGPYWGRLKLCAGNGDQGENVGDITFHNYYYDAATSSHTWQQNMIISDLGRVGIGSSPDYTLDPDDTLNVYVHGNRYQAVGLIPARVQGMSINVSTFSTPSKKELSYYFRARDRGANTTYFYINGNGKTGIGNVLESPGAMLHVRSPDNTSSTNALVVQSTDSSTSPTSYPNMLVVKDDGKVGIGTAAPSTTLDVNGDAHISEQSVFDDTVCIGTASPSASSKLSISCSSVPAIRALGDYAATLVYSNNSGTGQAIRGDSNSGTAIMANSVSGSAIEGTTQDLGALAAVFSNTAGGVALCTTNGTVGFGTSIPGPGVKVHIDGKLYVNGDIEYTGSCFRSSSIRWKENIKPVENALEKTAKLQGVTFNWKEDKKPDIGLIAEEVGKVFPEAVTYEENGVDAKGINYNSLVGVLVEAVKELKTKNDELETRIAALEAE
ncbi:MAG: tail fiber domain-containing protein [Candidatus Margulisiibacteriota bacterium]